MRRKRETVTKEGPSSSVCSDSAAHCMPMHEPGAGLPLSPARVFERRLRVLRAREVAAQRIKAVGAVVLRGDKGRTDTEGGGRGGVHSRRKLFYKLGREAGTGQASLHEGEARALAQPCVPLRRTGSASCRAAPRRRWRRGAWPRRPPGGSRGGTDQGGAVPTTTPVPTPPSRQRCV